MRRLLWTCTLVCLLLGRAPRLWAAGPTDETAHFYEEVKPLLIAKCVACHGPDKQAGNLRLDSLEAAKTGGDQGPAVVPGNLESSLLIEAISFGNAELQMPPKQKLSDREINILTQWVKKGAIWPEPVAILFEDDPQFLAALTSGIGTGRIVADQAFSGQRALGMTPLQRDAVEIPGWQFRVRQNPQPGEYRFLRLAWKKRGTGSVMLELARNGHWPDAKDPKGRYVAGPNTTGWAAISVNSTAPTDWTVATMDLWKDIGDFTLTGLAPTCDGGDEAFFDAILLGPTVAALDDYRPGAPIAADQLASSPVGDAFTDRRNPVRRLYRGERLDLWSLRKPVRPEVPQGAPHPVDAFIQSRLTPAGLTPSPEADPRTLIRRLTFDLTGLPPTAAEVDAFAAAPTEKAYQDLVTRLLDSPRYGERQARLWLDVVRYADTNGYERDEFRPLAWQYRDYVVRSFNQDKPYTQFVREQLAGDELVSGAPASAAEADALIATGFLRLGQWDSTAGIFQEETRLRAEVMADLTNTTASAFLGLTMSCCQCHDHKYDPLTQADHFRLRAFFAGVTARDDLAISLADEQAQIQEHNARIEPQITAKKAELSQLKKDQPQYAPLEQQINELEAAKRQPRRAMGATDAGASVPATHVLYQGDYSAPREAVEPGFVSVLAPGPAAIVAPHPQTTGRRLALANWITNPDNPWTARVIVNRIWQQHFGTGLVATPNDLGYSGTRPTHPELLDWLAVEFVARGNSIKQLHRLIVTSFTYRQASHISAAGAAHQHPDAENRLLWRQNVRRLDAEMLRDSLLAVSGKLQPDDGGKPRWPEVSEELRHAQPAILEAEKGGDGGRMQGWYADPVEKTDVRSLFLIRKRCLPIPFLQAFDLPDTTTSCARRDTTVVAPQALMLLNSPEGIRYSQALAQRVLPANMTPDLQQPTQAGRVVQQLFELTLGRKAGDDELALAITFLERHQREHAKKLAADQAARNAVTDLCRALLNLNEFIYID